MVMTIGELHAVHCIDPSLTDVVNDRNEIRCAERVPAQQAWALMHRFVEALGFRLGGGRGKILLQLRDGLVTLANSRRPTASTPPTRP
jgi:hypothetical protein